MKDHAKHSPSSFDKLKQCEGWQSLPDTGQIHPATACGNRCHDALETGDDSHLESEREEEMVNLCREYAARFPGEHKLIEPRIEIMEGCWGYADLVHLDKKDSPVSGDLFDWKFGWNPVESTSDNYQGIAYALGVFKLYPTLMSLTVHFVMPRLGKVDAYCFTRGRDYERMELQIGNVLDRARNPKEENFAPSWKACQYCARKGLCPALFSKVGEVHGEGLPLPESGLSEASPEELSLYRNLADVMEGWAKQVKEYVLAQRLHGGVDIPGWDLKHIKGARKISDPKHVVEVAKAFGLTEEDIIESCRVQLTRLEKKIRDNLANKNKSHELPADFNPENLIKHGADGKICVDPDIAGLTKAERVKLFTYALGDSIAHGSESITLQKNK